jgi:hypothetical protein
LEPFSNVYILQWNYSYDNRCLFFRRLKINHESHEFILESGTVTNSTLYGPMFSMRPLSPLLSFVPSTTLCFLYGPLWPSVSSTALCTLHSPLSPLRTAICPILGPISPLQHMAPLRPSATSLALYAFFFYGTLPPLQPSVLFTALCLLYSRFPLHGSQSPLRPSVLSMTLCLIYSPLSPLQTSVPSTLSVLSTLPVPSTPST